VLVALLERCRLLEHGFDAGRVMPIELLPLPGDANARVADLLGRIERAVLERAERVIAFADAERCRHRHIAEHFGETFERPCMRCDVCDSAYVAEGSRWAASPSRTEGVRPRPDRRAVAGARSASPLGAVAWPIRDMAALKVGMRVMHATFGAVTIRTLDRAGGCVVVETALGERRTLHLPTCLASGLIGAVAGTESPAAVGDGTPASDGQTPAPLTGGRRRAGRAAAPLADGNLSGRARARLRGLRQPDPGGHRAARTADHRRALGGAGHRPGEGRPVRGSDPGAGERSRATRGRRRTVDGVSLSDREPPRPGNQEANTITPAEDGAVWTAHGGRNRFNSGHDPHLRQVPGDEDQRSGACHPRSIRSGQFRMGLHEASTPVLHPATHHKTLTRPDRPQELH
jgi:hypothetical protein